MRGNAGKVSSSEMLTSDIAPVRKRFSRDDEQHTDCPLDVDEVLLHRANSDEKCSIMRAAIENGMPSPAE